MRQHPKHIVNYDKDLSFEGFVGLVGHNIKYVSEIFVNKIGREPKLSEKIDFDTACLLIDDIDGLQGGPLIIPTILKRGKLLSSKTLKQISVGEKVSIDVYPFDYYNRTLECISKMCCDTGSWGDDLGWCSEFKMFQMKTPDKIFIIYDDDCMSFDYRGGYYHLNDPLEYLGLLGGEEIDEDFLDNLKNEIDNSIQYNELVNYIIAHKDEYVSSENGKKCSINGIVSDLKNGKTCVKKSKQVCNKCGRPLSSIYYETPCINYTTYHELICPHCKIDYGVDPEYGMTGVCY